METKLILKETWLTQKPKAYALPLALLSGVFLFFASFSYFTGFLRASEWMIATPYEVFTKQEYWRAWTTIFAHGDLGHLLSNTLLFLPFAYLLFSHFGLWFFPLLGIFLGGITNFIVLKTLPENVGLLGISGVVYWMGAAWLTLILLIDKRDKWKRRFGGVLFLTIMIFIPETYKPEVSYLSHFVGAVLGILSGFANYAWNWKKYKAAEVSELVILEPLEILPEEEAG